MCGFQCSRLWEMETHAYIYLSCWVLSHQKATDFLPTTHSSTWVCLPLSLSQLQFSPGFFVIVRVTACYLGGGGGISSRNGSIHCLKAQPVANQITASQSKSALRFSACLGLLVAGQFYSLHSCLFYLWPRGKTSRLFPCYSAQSSRVRACHFFCKSNIKYFYIFLLSVADCGLLLTPYTLQL